MAALKCEGEMRELEAIPEEVQKRKELMEKTTCLTLLSVIPS